MNVCCCALAGTKACENCPNNKKLKNADWTNKQIDLGQIPDWSDVAVINRLVEKMEDKPRQILIDSLITKYRSNCHDVEEFYKDQNQTENVSEFIR